MYFMHDTIEMGVVVTGQCPCIVYLKPNVIQITAS